MTIDIARVLGIAVAAVALLLRLPLGVVLVAAVVATAGLRAVT